jgi:excinuclease ABC subunit C
VGHETRVKILSKYRSAEAFMAAPIEDIEILLGKVRGNNLRDQVAKYCADFIRPSGLDDNKDSED